MIKLNVPWMTQMGAIAPAKNDCGHACLVMLHRFINPRSKLTVRSLTQIYNARTTAFDLIRLGGTIGLDLRLVVVRPVFLEQFQDMLELRMPLICLVDYPKLELDNPHGINIGSHWVLIVGFEEDAFLIHDPYWKGADRDGQGGAFLKVPFDPFVRAFRGAALSLKRERFVRNG